ncbi:UNVERIFIED_CONTAM: hypothetical protein NCL1_33261 [Trichonephila clavipes]
MDLSGSLPQINLGVQELTERINGRRTEGRENKDSVMQRIVDTLEPVLTPLRSLTSHVAGNRTISAIFPAKSKVLFLSYEFQKI